MSLRILLLMLAHTESVLVQQVSMDLNDFLCLGCPSYVNSTDFSVAQAIGGTPGEGETAVLAHILQLLADRAWKLEDEH